MISHGKSRHQSTKGYLRKADKQLSERLIVEKVQVIFRVNYHLFFLLRQIIFRRRERSRQ